MAMFTDPNAGESLDGSPGSSWPACSWPPSSAGGELRTKRWLSVNHRWVGPALRGRLKSLS
jgi:hypothetical protein